MTFVKCLRILKSFRQEVLWQLCEGCRLICMIMILSQYGCPMADKQIALTWSHGPSRFHPAFRKCFSSTRQWWASVKVPWRQRELQRRNGWRSEVNQPTNPVDGVTFVLSPRDKDYHYACELKANQWCYLLWTLWPCDSCNTVMLTANMWQTSMKLPKSYVIFLFPIWRDVTKL